LEHRITGKGNYVLLIHGFAEDLAIWENIQNQLSNDFTLISINLPGTGRTPALANCSIEAMAVQVLNFVSSITKEPIAIIGHSMGGYVALACASINPKQIQALYLLNSTALADTTEKVEARKKSIEFIKEHGKLAFLKNTIPNLFAEPALFKTTISTLIENANKIPTDVIIGYYKAMIERPDRTAVLKNSNNMVGFCIGKLDKAVLYETAMPQTYLPTRAQVSIMPAGAHMGMYEHAHIVKELNYWLQNIW
jgi:pimeloyl-ACP methyl ester carboxylesterase